MNASASPAMRGLLWMSASMLCFSVVTTMIRLLTQDFPVLEVVMFRSVLGVVFLLPWLARAGVDGLRTNRWGLYILRMVVLLAGQAGWYYGLREIPLADATALHFTLPLFGVLFAVWLLGETAGRHRWIATIVGFAGALVIIRPGFTAIEWAALAVIFSAACYAYNSIATKDLARTDPVNRVLFYGFFLSIPAIALPVALDWVGPSWADMPAILLFGFASLVAQWCLTYALKIADASLLAPADYLRLPFAAILGYFVFGEFPGIWTWLGAAIIVASTYYVARTEARAGAAAHSRTGA